MWCTASAPGIAMCQSVAVESHMRESRPWSIVSTIGLDFAKHVFQVHGERFGRGSGPPKAAT